MNRRRYSTAACALLCLAVLFSASSAALADVLVGDFEGDLDAGAFGTWDTDHTSVDDDPSALAGLVSSGFLTDDPLTTASEGVTSGSQSLLLEHYQWQNDFKPYLSASGGFDPAQAILDGTSLQLDLTPIIPDVGGVAWRQVFLAIGYGEGEDEFFGKVQRDWPETSFNEEGEPQPFTVSWNFNAFVANDIDPLQADTFKGWAQSSIDAEEELDFFLIVQGRDLDEDELEIGFNPFSPTSVKTAIDNVQFIGLTVGLPGDANGDGSVDLLDLDILGMNFGLMTGNGSSDGDFNNDGNVDLLDLDILGQNFGASSASAIPEPATAWMVVWSGMLIPAALRRRRL